MGMNGGDGASGTVAIASYMTTGAGKLKIVRTQLRHSGSFLVEAGAVPATAIVSAQRALRASGGLARSLGLRGLRVMAPANRAGRQRLQVFSAW